MQLSCVKNVSVINNDCLKKCQGLFIAGIEKSEFDKEQVNLEILSKVVTDYEKYKASGEFQGLEGRYIWQNNLQLISIRFETLAYDEVTMDTAAKFVDRLSAIGGTFGLLTGFSLISGVEILFFLVKFLLNCVTTKKE